MRREAGFSDAYAAAVAPETVFCFEDIHSPQHSTDAGCTSGVSAIAESFGPGLRPPLQLDYIFGRGELVVRDSELFDEESLKFWRHHQERSLLLICALLVLQKSPSRSIGSIPAPLLLLAAVCAKAGASNTISNIMPGAKTAGLLLPAIKPAVPWAVPW